MAISMLSFVAMPSTVEARNFIRGDANSDGGVDISDYFFLMAYLWQGGSTPSCMDAADVNDDGQVDNTDVVYLYNCLFGGGNCPPSGCGADTTSDSLTCVYSPCP